ncbi:MAG: DSD1 family PLP-dependent enzyme [Thermoanaerobaculia bacterium]
MTLAEVQTPSLVVDLDALERNVAKLGAFVRERGIRHRAHAKMHRSVDVARLQIERGGACGLCCQKVSEAECFARAGFRDILVSHEVRDPLKIDRLARLPLLGARTIVLVDDPANVAELSAAAKAHGTTIECLVELDCGAGLCGVATTAEVVALAQAIAAAAGLVFAGIQAYQGKMQHLGPFEERRAASAAAAARAREVVTALAAAGLSCGIVGGGGTGSYRFDADSGVYDELQCGSYAFLDDEYGRILDAEGRRLDEREWEHALFLLTSVVSRAKDGSAVCDAGLKVCSFDAGPPVVFGRDDVAYVRWADEHGLLDDPGGVLRVGEKLRLVPGHCDPTCNLHDWYVAVRGGTVEALWPVSARGKSL